MAIRNEQFILPITKNRIKAIDKMEAEFYKTQREIKAMLSQSQSPPPVKGPEQDPEDRCRLYKRQAKYYKSMWLSQKKEIDALGRELKSLRDLTTTMVKNKMYKISNEKQ